MQGKAPLQGCVNRSRNSTAFYTDIALTGSGPNQWRRPDFAHPCRGASPNTSKPVATPPAWPPATLTHPVGVPRSVQTRGASVACAFGRFEVQRKHAGGVREGSRWPRRWRCPRFRSAKKGTPAGVREAGQARSYGTTSSSTFHAPLPGPLPGCLSLPLQTGGNASSVATGLPSRTPPACFR